MNDNDARDRDEMLERAKNAYWKAFGDESDLRSNPEKWADFALAETEAAQARNRELEAEVERYKRMLDYLESKVLVALTTTRP